VSEAGHAEGAHGDGRAEWRGGVAAINNSRYECEMKIATCIRARLLNAGTTTVLSLLTAVTLQWYHIPVYKIRSST
jgi:hypothetical protein